MYKFTVKNLSLFIAVIALLLALVLRTFFIDSFRSESLYLRDVQRNVVRALDQMTQETTNLRQVLSNTSTPDLTKLSVNHQFPYYIFRDGKLVYWSDYRFVPSLESLPDNQRYQYQEFDEGSFIVRRDTVNDWQIFQLLLIREDIEIDNRYISSGYNPDFFPQPETVDVREVSSVDASSSVISYRDHALFTVQTNAPQSGYREHETAKSFQAMITTLIAVSIILLLFNVFRVAHHKFRQQQIDQGFVIVAGSLLLLRSCMIYFGYPSTIIPSALFDGRQFAASSINPSLGDLLLNCLSVLILVIYVFNYYRDSRTYREILQSKPQIKTVATILGLFLSFFALYWHYDVVRSIYYNSQWTLDVTENLSFPALKNVSLLIFVINTVSYFLGAHLIFRTCISLNQRSYIPFRFSFLAALALGVGMSSLWKAPTFPVIILTVAYFSLLYLFNLPKYLTKVSYVTFLYVFAGSLVSAAACAIAAYDMHQVETEDNKQKFVNQLLVENDILGEFLLHEAGEKIQNDPLIKNRLISPIDRLLSSNASLEIVRQKIRRVYLSNYFDRYEVEIHLFNSEGQPLDDGPAYTYAEWEEDVSGPNFTTDYSNIFFMNYTDAVLNTEAGQRYYLFLDIENFGNTIGSIVIELVSRRYTPNQVYPELLVDRSYLQSYTDTDFSYAIFSPSQPDEDRNRLLYSSGDERVFNYFAQYDFSRVTSGLTVNRGDYTYLLVQDKDDYIVISSPAYSFINIISNFSFLYLLLVFTILLLLALYSVYFAFKKENLNFSTKIQLYLNAAFFMPLLALSITTISIISSSYNQEVDQSYLEQAEQISSAIMVPYEEYIRDELSQDDLSAFVRQVASFTETDINLFDTTGNLIVTSQPLIYENGLLSPHINIQALISIRVQGDNKGILDESVGSLMYKSSYVGLKSYQTGQILGIVSIPFFESRSQLESRIIQVLTNVTNIFTFVFIAFLIISYLASVLLTYPLKYITQKIRRTSLADYNEPLSWDSNDEIGLMVGEYNRMLVNLEASKAALARNEKESAWREMAKQVAHEIKNPLTPMKLSLQLLKRRLENDFKFGMNAEAVQEMEKPMDNLLHQVDTLNDIASSFSSFAQMPLPKSEPYELSAVVHRTVNLYEEEKLTIDVDVDGNDFWVLGDRQLMGRILSNLLINAKQSIPQDRKPVIRVSLRKFGSDKVVLKVSDNGTGIAKEIQNKVFLPNFSTKYAGSGIGLAIAKRGIEHAGGRITFDTQEGAGTTFFIELPLVTQRQAVVEL